MSYKYTLRIFHVFLELLNKISELISSETIIEHNKLETKIKNNSFKCLYMDSFKIDSYVFNKNDIEIFILEILFLRGFKIFLFFIS